MSEALFKGRTVCVITGASRGIGRCLATSLAQHLPENSAMLLLARNVDQLKEVANSVKLRNDKIVVSFNQFNQGNLKECMLENIQNIFRKKQIQLENYETAVIFHNAGTLGDVTKYSWELDSNAVEATINVNLTGVILLNASLMTELRRSEVNTKVVVNISSLAALTPFASQSLYCTGKAARNMFFQTFAKEDPSARVLNWGPGPVDTDMQRETIHSADPTIRQMFLDLRANNKLLSCEDSVGKLLTVLQRNDFESGQHIDYYDV